MRLILASRQSPAPARAARAARRDCPTPSSPPRSTRRRARASCRPLCLPDGGGEGGGGRPSRAASSSPPTRWSPRAGGSCPRPRPRPRRGGADAAVRPPPPGPFGGRPDRRRRAAPGIRLSTSIVAFKRLSRGGDRRLSRQRRMARQGGRLCHPGPGRGAGPDAVGQPFGRDGPAALRDPRPAARRRLSRLAEWLYEEGIGENRAILVEDGEILEAAIELPGELRCGSVLAGRLAGIPIPGRRGIVDTDAAAR